eukprot:tig00000114_g6023.t1
MRTQGGEHTIVARASATASTASGRRAPARASATSSSSAGPSSGSWAVAIECFDYVDETVKARSYVPRPIDTREIRGLSLDPVTRFPAIVDFVVKHWLDVRLWQWPLLFLDGEYSPRKTSSFLSQVELSAPSMDPQRRVVCWPPQFGPVNLPEEVKREFGQFGEISGAADPVKAGAGAGAAPAASRAGAMGGYLKAMCWDDPVEYLRKIAACGCL